MAGTPAPILISSSKRKKNHTVGRASEPFSVSDAQCMSLEVKGEGLISHDQGSSPSNLYYYSFSCNPFKGGSSTSCNYLAATGVLLLLIYFNANAISLQISNLECTVEIDIGFGESLSALINKQYYHRSYSLLLI